LIDPNYKRPEEMDIEQYGSNQFMNNSSKKLTHNKKFKNY